MLHRKFITASKIPPAPIPYTELFISRSTRSSNIYDYYGRCVALTNAGDKLFVGSDETSMLNNVNGTSGPGRVYVYDLTAVPPTPTLLATLTASDGRIGDSFGKSIAISDDGNLLIVGAPGATVGNNVQQGAVYIFQWNPAFATWTQTHKIVANDGTAEDSFGYSVSMSEDGTTIAVGANIDDVVAGYKIGCVYVYSVVPLLTGTANVSGTTLTVLSTTIQNGLLRVGAVITGIGIPPNTYITAFVTGTGGPGTYTLSNTVLPAVSNVTFEASTSWQDQVKIVSSDKQPDDNFGCSVSLSADGGAIAIGSSGSDVGPAPNNGAVYFYTRAVVLSQLSYTNQQKIVTNVPVTGQSFGFSVDMDGAAAAMVVGAPFNSDTAQAAGCVYVFTRNVAGVWSQRLLQRSSDSTAGDKFGWSVSIGSLARYFVAGAPGCNTPPAPPPAPYAEAGATYVYYNGGTGWGEVAKNIASTSDTGDQMGYSTAITPDGQTTAAGAPTKSEDTLPPPSTTYIHGAVYVFQQ